MAETLGLRLRLPARFVKAGTMAARLHMKACSYEILRPGTKTDLLMALHTAGILKPFSWMTAADSGKMELPLQLQHDLDRILAVRLPEAWRDKGSASGDFLRQQRCMVLGNL